jgi:hypothetical protein
VSLTRGRGDGIVLPTKTPIFPGAVPTFDGGYCSFAITVRVRPRLAGGEFAFLSASRRRLDKIVSLQPESNHD